ncbi:MAG: hypothetical protein WAN46_02580 [Gammaproteobacteria bacterium]|jgi:hypothetical protein
MEVEQQKGAVDEFFRSKSMLTPGVAGATAMMITGTLVSQFELPGHITGLLVSFLLGLVVWADKSVPMIQRIVFYIINSLIIFTVAIGMNETGVAMTKSDAQAQYEQRWIPSESQERSFFQSWFGAHE